MNNQTDMRSLRSKGNENGREDDRFDFDTQEYSIDPNKKFLVLRSRVRSYTKEAVGKSNETSSTTPKNSDIQNTKNLINHMTLDIKRNDISSLIPNDDVNFSSSESDPLIDEVYSSFHRRMLSQENRMHQVDETQSINEAERLLLINDKLDMPAWVSTLQRVTVIKNPQDEEELHKKKKMTKQYIKKLLDRYNKMKKHNHVLKKEIKKVRLVPIHRTPKIYQNLDRKYDVEYHSSSDDEEDENNISNEEIIQRRLLRREKQCGGSIIIGAHSSLVNAKYAILAEPLKTPSLILATSAERKAWKSVSGMPKELHYSSHSENQYAKFKEKILIPLTLTADVIQNDTASSMTTTHTEKENNSLNSLESSMRTTHTGKEDNSPNSLESSMSRTHTGKEDNSPNSLEATDIEESSDSENSSVIEKTSISPPISAFENNGGDRKGISQMMALSGNNILLNDDRNNM